MKNIVIILMLLSSSVMAATYGDIEINSAQIDAAGNYNIVFSMDPGTDFVSNDTKVVLQIRPKFSTMSPALFTSYPDNIIKWKNPQSSSRMFVMSHSSTSTNGTIGYKTFEGQFYWKEMSEFFSENEDIEIRVMAFYGSAWPPAYGTSKTKWYKFSIDPPQPDPGLYLVNTVVTNNVLYFRLGNTVNGGCLSSKWEYYDNVSLTWKIMHSTSSLDEVSTATTGSTAYFINAYEAYTYYNTDGQTRVTYIDTDGNEGGPFEGPNIIGVSGITGTPPAPATPEIFDVYVTSGISTITGYGFEPYNVSVSKVEVCNNATYASATVKINNTDIETWTLEECYWTLDSGSLAVNSEAWVFITNSSGNISEGYSITIPEQ